MESAVKIGFQAEIAVLSLHHSAGCIGASRFAIAISDRSGGIGSHVGAKKNVGGRLTNSWCAPL
jgi:hypothetical protein